MKQTAKMILWSLVITVLIGAAAAAVYSGLHSRQELQNEILSALDRNAGRYDEQSLVLTGTNKAEAQKVAALFGAKLRMTEDGSFAQLTLPEGTTVRDVFSMEESRPYLKKMTADYQASVSSSGQTASPPESGFTGVGANKQGYLNYINMGNVRDYSGGIAAVAVIDSGIDIDHAAFSGKISENSFNATVNKVVKDYDMSLIDDRQGHGTQVAGIIAGHGDYPGIALTADLLVIKAECDENGIFSRASDLIFGIYYAIEQDVDVINMSFSIDSSDEVTIKMLESALKLAYDSDIICVAAAGNSATSAHCWPACSEYVIGVGAFDANWRLESYSNYGDNVNLCAPGTAYTTFPNGQYGYATGTSMAAPMVTGAIALYLSQNPYVTCKSVTGMLYTSCYDLGMPGRDWEHGFGALDVHAFVDQPIGTITFDMLTDEVEDETHQFVKGHTLQEMPEPERLYAVFDGWYYDDKCTQEFQYYTDTLQEDITLYAKWVNESDGIPFTYATLDDGTVEIRSYTGRRSYIVVPSHIEGKPVTSIGDNAFEGQAKLRRVTLPDTVTNIGMYAFSGCRLLTGIEIPAGVQVLREHTLKGCEHLTSVVFSGSSKLTTIETGALEKCSRLKRIELPASLESVDGSAFYGTLWLQQIQVQSGNKHFKSVDGVLFTADRTKLIVFPASFGTSYTLPLSTAEIGKYAFAYCKLNSVSLNQVRAIGDGAFEFSSLKNITLPDTLTSMGTGVFADNDLLSGVTIGSGLTELPAFTFANCDKVLKKITIPAGIRVIGDSAFYKSSIRDVTFAPGSELSVIGSNSFFFTAIESIALPQTLESIGSGAFSSCLNLTEIEFPSSLQYIGSAAFYACSSLKDIYIPASVTELGYGAFGACGSLSYISVDKDNLNYLSELSVIYTKDYSVLHTYPAGSDRSSYKVHSNMLTPTTTIAPMAFSGAYQLRVVDLPLGLQDIGDYAFSGCALGGISIPDSVTSIGTYAFYMAQNLKEVLFSENATLPKISYSAFMLSGLESFTVPASVSAIEEDAFRGCSNLTTVTFAQNSKLTAIPAYVFYGCENLQNITFLPGSALKQIQDHGFEGMVNLQTVDFGDAKLKEIHNYAFRYCENLQNFTLPKTLTSIGRFAFHGCASLADFVIPAKVQHIGSFAFVYTEDLSIYFTSEALPAYLEEDWDFSLSGYYLGVESVATKGDYKYANLTSGSVSIIKYQGAETDLDLTSVDLGSPITGIGGQAFAHSAITSVILPDTLTVIQAEAFRETRLTAVSIPANVTFIGRYAFANTPIDTLTFQPNGKLSVIEQYAFDGTQNLKTVAIPASVTRMGTGVFYESGLTSVTFAPGIQLSEIPREAFRGTKLTAIALPDSITLVNDNAFAGISTLRSLQFGSSNVRLMSNAFYKTGLEQLHIPANVTYIGEFCFVALKNLKEFTVDSNHSEYTAVDGMLLSKDGRKLIAAPAGQTGSVTVPQGVEVIGFGAFEDCAISEVKFLEDANILSIGNRAFLNCRNITKLTVPASVIAIDYYAFGYCENLASVTFADGNAIQGIYEGAFLGCGNLQTPSLPDSVVEISDFAFYGCHKVARVPVSENTNLARIGTYAFAYTDISGKLTASPTLMDIGSYAFMGNDLTEVEISNVQQENLVLGLGVFKDCTKLESIALPFIGEFLDGEQFTWFGYVFGAGSGEANDSYVPEALKHVTINGDITFIGKYGFSGLSNLETIDLPHSVTTLYDYAFQDTVAKYALTNTITIISGTYDDEHELWDTHVGKGISGHLVLADNLQIVRPSAFTDCVYLEGITLPGSLKQIPGSCFSRCTSLKNVIISEGIESIGSSFQDCTALEEIVIPDSVTQIGTYAFSGCTGLKKVKLSEKITAINSNTFKDCSSLTEITIPDSVSSIGSRAFMNCSGLMKLTIGEGVSDSGISSMAFSNMVNLYEIINRSSNVSLTIGRGIAKYARAITNPDGSRTYYEGTNDFAYVDTTDGLRFICQDGVYTLVAYLGKADTVTLPATINGSSYSISQLENVKNVILSEGITRIDEEAFKNCKTLSSISFPSTLETIGQDAFTGCTNLNAIYISDLESWCNLDHAHTFSFTFPAMYELYLDGELLTHAEIPQTVTELRDSCFYNCRSIETVTLHDKLVKIGEGAFWNCIKLNYVSIPDSVTVMGMRAFYGCAALRGAVIGNGVASIGKYVFQNCSALSSVVTGSNVSSIDDYAFDGCSILRELRIPAGVSGIGQDALPVDTNVIFTGNNPRFAYENGILYNADKTQIEYMHSDISGDIVLPDTLTSINERTFKIGADVTSLTIPDNTHIGYGNPFGYADHTALQKINISDNHTSLRMVDGILYDKEMTRIFWMEPNHEGDVVIPEGVTEIPITLFYMQPKITSVTLPDSLPLYFGGYSDLTFSFCDSLKRVHFGSQTPAINGSTFIECSALEAVSVSNDHNRYFSKDGIVYDRETASTAFVPQSVAGIITVPDGIESVDFSHRANITGVVLPDSVKNANFNYCVNLKSVRLNEGITFAEFGNCSALEEVKLPNSLTQIPQYAFIECTSLKQVTLGNAVTSIGDGAFMNCTQLQEFVISDSVQSLGSYVFSGCTGLQKAVIGSGITAIPSCAFYECERLQSVYMGSNVTTIEESAFYLCKNLARITLPASVTEIQLNAFSNCYNLYDIHNNSDLTLSFGSNDNGMLAYNAKSITDKMGRTSLRDPGSDYAVFETEDGFRFIRENREYTLIGYFGSEKRITLPANIHGHPYDIFNFSGAAHVTVPEGITHLGDTAFNSCELVSLTLPDSMEEFSTGAVSWCPNLANIYVSDANEHLYFADGILYNKPVTKILWNQPVLSGVITVPEGVTHFRLPIHHNGSGVTAIHLPGTLTHIEDSAFSAFTALTELDIPDSVTYIGREAFRGTDILTNPAFQSGGLTIMDGWLLDVDETLKCMDVIAGLRGITMDAYDGCFMLECAIYGGNVFDLSNVKVLLVTDFDMVEYDVSHISSLESIIYFDTDLDAWRYPVVPENGTIFVAGRKDDLKWERLYPELNQNQIVYRNSWIIARFYDDNGALLELAPWRTHEVIRRPILADRADDVYTYEFAGWDLDGNETADSVPATSLTDISAHALTLTRKIEYTVTFRDSDGTVLHQFNQTFGEAVRLPNAPQKDGMIFEGWLDYTDGMTVTGNLEFTALWHSHSYKSSFTAPTCTEQGYSTYICACGHSYQDGFVGQLGHEYGDWYTTEHASCTTAGQQRKDCIRCSEFVTEEIPMVDHNCNNGIAVPPTCTEQGYTPYTCIVCGHSYNADFVPALGHSFTNYISDGNADCVTDGTKTALCDRLCGTKDTVADPGSATGHSYGQWYVVIPATSQTEGLNRRDCHCGHYEEVKTPVRVGPTEITSSVYTIQNGFVSKIATGTTVADFLKGFGEEGYLSVVKPGTQVTSDTLVSSGMELHLTVDGELLQVLTVVVSGDTNGDGKISITDMIIVKSHILKKEKLTGAIALAADLNGDDGISITDFIRIKGHILGKEQVAPR